MTDFLNLPTKEQFDMQNAILASIASHVGTEGIKISNWEDVQRIVRMGLADKVFTVGDQFVSKYGADKEIIWDVIGIDHDIPTDKKYTHSLTIQTHDCILDAQFDAKEALYYVETELPAGTYNFTYNSVTYQFTLTQPVPTGGQITFPWAYNTDILTTKISTYESQASTVAIETVDIVVGSEGTELTPINDMNRCRYGSNNYLESNVRQWLNSNEASFTWTPKTNYDRPSTGSPYSGAGFLKLLDPELVAVIGEADKQVARNTVTDGGGQDLFSDKVFLLSRVEVYGGAEGDTAGEEPYPYYSALATSPVFGELAGRIKLLNGSLGNWWLRSPNVGTSGLTRYVSIYGSGGNNSATSANELSPACVII